MVNVVRIKGRLLLTEPASIASPSLSTKGLITTARPALTGLTAVPVSGFWSKAAPAYNEPASLAMRELTQIIRRTTKLVPIGENAPKGKG